MSLQQFVSVCLSASRPRGFHTVILAATGGPHGHEFGETGNDGGHGGPRDEEADDKTLRATIAQTLDEGDELSGPGDHGTAGQAEDAPELEVAPELLGLAHCPHLFGIGVVGRAVLRLLV